jgi:hypothetical protein
MQYIGPYYRVPVEHDGAGSYNRIVGARWEGGYGPFALVKGATLIVSNDYEILYEDSASVDNNEITFDVTSQTTGRLARNHITRQSQRTAPQQSTLQNFHLRAIIGELGVVQGVAFANVTTGAASRTTPANTMRICNDGVFGTIVNQPLSIWLPVGPQRAWDVFVNAETSNEFRQHHHCAGRDWSLQNPSVKDLRSTVNATLSTFGYISPANNTTKETIYAPIGSDAVYFVIRFSMRDGKLRSVTCQPVESYATSRSNALAPTTPYGDGSEGRSSYGTPVSGIFPTRGEWIANIKPAAAQYGWYVTVEGALAPAWAGSTAVFEGELRSNAGHIYYALASGTTGATAPTHTSGEVSDDTVTWVYYAPQATLTAYPV